MTRNGGPTAYRADLAHRATEHRAQRRRRAAPRGQQAPPRADGRDDEAVRAYEETFTTLLMGQGLPTMSARVLTCLFTTDAGSLTAAELVQRLQVSPASVSKAIAFLESQGLVRRERDDRRRERYLADNDVWYESIIASARAHARLAETARQGAGVLGPGTPAAVRLENIARFDDFVGQSITRAVKCSGPGRGGFRFINSLVASGMLYVAATSAMSFSNSTRRRSLIVGESDRG